MAKMESTHRRILWRDGAGSGRFRVGGGGRREGLGWAARSGLPGGCPLYAAAFELDDAEEGPVRDFLMQSKGEWSGMLEGLVREAVELGQLGEDLDAVQFVWQLEGIYLSHHVSQRLMRDPEADARALTAFDALVASSLPGQTTRSESRP